jgi:hypothetical protein
MEHIDTESGIRFDLIYKFSRVKGSASCFSGDKVNIRSRNTKVGTDNLESIQGGDNFVNDILGDWYLLPGV